MSWNLTTTLLRDNQLSTVVCSKIQANNFQQNYGIIFKYRVQQLAIREK